MKVKVEIKYPVWETHAETIELDIPDIELCGVSVENWIYEREHQILEEHGAEGDMSIPIELGYAGIRIIEEK